MKRIRRTLGVMLILTSILITQIPIQSVSAYQESFKLDGKTLVQYTGTDETVSIPGSVKIIGEEAFAGNTSIKEVVIEGKVEEIRYHAFADCPNLTKVTIGDSVITIGNAAFCNNDQLIEVSIGSSVENFGSGVFAGCELLKQVTISETNADLVSQNGAIYDKKQEILYEVLAGREANDFNMPDTVSEIKPYAFWGCQNVYSAHISQNLNEIGAYAFSNCKGLKVLEIPYSVNRIQMKAFEDCISLEGISIPLSVQFIHDSAFDGCPLLKANTIENSYSDEYFKRLQISPVTIAEYEDIVENVSRVSLTEEEINAALEAAQEQNGSTESIPEEEPINPLEEEGTLGYAPIVGREAVILIDNTKQQVFTGSKPEENLLPDPDLNDTDQIVEPEDEIIFTTDRKGYLFPKYTITGTAIANQAFYLNEEMQEYYIPEFITVIGKFAFARTALTEIEIPEGVVKIDYGAFYHCDYLQNVTIASTVKEIAPYAFSHTKWLDDWLIYGSEDFLVVGDGILLAYKGDRENVVIPNTVKSIAAGAFKGHTEIIAVDLGSNITSIGEEAFQDCTSLATIKGGSALQAIHDRAFMNCPIETIRIQKNVTTIGLNAFNMGDYAVFQGLSLPKVSYDEEAQRLSNYDFRVRAIQNTDYVIISNSIYTSEMKDSVLNPNGFGYCGLTLSILTEADSNSNGTVELRLCTMQPDASGTVVVPDSYEIYGRTYRLISIDPDAFSYYGDCSSWADNDIREIVLPNSFINEEQELLGGINFSQTSIQEDIPIKINVQSTSIKNQEFIDVNFVTMDNHYTFWINESNNVASEMEEAYEKLFGETEFSNITGVEFLLLDEKEQVEITKLGSNTMELKIPVPISYNSENIRMMCMDENGQLETVDYVLETDDIYQFLIFKVSHLSKYCIYELAVSEEGQAEASGLLDMSPDTGERTTSIPWIKWIPAFFVFAIGVFLIIWRGGKRNSKTVSA